MSKAPNTSDDAAVKLTPLPKVWAWSNLGELGLVRLGKTPRKADYRDAGTHKIVKFRDIDEHGQIDWYNASKGYVDSSPEVLKTLKELEVGDVLVTASAHMSEHIGKKVGIVSKIPEKYKEVYVVGEILQIRAKEGIDPRWILYYLQSSQGYKAIQRRVHGVHLIASRAKNIEIPIAPFDQQNRIVAEIEKQFSRLEEAVANLKRVKANLKRYKAAVLKAAVEGRLVETEAELALREGRSYETGEPLLQRILKARRSQWKGRGKYKEPTSPDTTDLPELPEGWCWMALNQVVSLENGDRSKNYPSRSAFVEQGIPFINAGHLEDGRIDMSDMNFISENLYSLLRAGKVQKSDLLFCLRGSLGKAAIVRNLSRGAIASSLVIVRPCEHVIPEYLLIYLMSTLASEQIQLYDNGSAQPNLSAADLGKFLVPVPPVFDQQRIVSEVDRRLSLLRETEAQVVANLNRAELLRQSILSQAFSGSISSQINLVSNYP